MKKIFPIVMGAILIGLAFFFGKSCTNKPVIPDHHAEIQKVDSANIIIHVAQETHKKVLDSIEPIMASLKDSIKINKKSKADNDKFLKQQIHNLEDLVSEALTDSSVSSTEREKRCDSIVQALKDAYPTYQEQQDIIEALVAQYTQLTEDYDSIEAANKSLQGSLIRSNMMKDTAFNKVIAADKKAGNQVKLIKAFAKGEFAVIITLILKIILSK